MVEGIVVYLGNTQIATNFYNRTESQKVKRPALGLGHYDILSLENILKISDECDKLFIVGLNKKVTPDKFLFNYLIENGLDMNRVTTFNGSMNIRMKHSGSGLSEKEYSKFLLQDTMNYSDDYSTASKLIIETMESLHRLYWSTGRVKEWQDILYESLLKQDMLHKRLQKKYNLPNTKGLKTNQVLKTNILEPWDKAELASINRLSNGFAATISAFEKPVNVTSGVLNFYFEHTDNAYWGLNPEEYYVLGIYGIGYQLRYSNKEYGRQALFYTNMSSFKGATTKELRQALYYRVYRTTLELTNKGINIAINVNRMILKLINLIKENSGNISLYACDNSNIAFAVPRSVEQQQLINRVKEIVLQLNLQDCFDYIVIGNSLSNPWRADRQDITVYEIDNKQER